jgi:hypothetical protein
MATSKITTMALTAGIVLGGAATEGINIYRLTHSSRIFQQRLRCKTVADAYVKDKSSDQKGGYLTLIKVDHATQRNTSGDFPFPHLTLQPRSRI